jgi:MFS family permease
MILTELSVRSTWSGRTAGLIFLPMAVPAFFEPLFGSFTDRFGARFVAFGCFSWRTGMDENSDKEEQ